MRAHVKRPVASAGGRPDEPRGAGATSEPLGPPPSPDLHVGKSPGRLSGLSLARLRFNRGTIIRPRGRDATSSDDKEAAIARSTHESAAVRPAAADPPPSAGVLAWWRFDALGRPTRLDPARPPTDASSPGDGGATWQWLLLDRLAPDVDDWLGRQATLPEAAREALLDEETRPRTAAMRPGRLVNLRGVNLNAGREIEDMVSLRLWLDDAGVMATQRYPLHSVAAVEALLDAGHATPTPGTLLAMLGEALLDRTAPVVDRLADELDALTAARLRDPAEAEDDESDLLTLWSRAITLHRYLAPQAEATAALGRASAQWLDEASSASLRETADGYRRLVEELDAARSRAAVLQERIEADRDRRLNRRMYALTIMAGVFLPLTFITGLLGMNVGGIPGAGTSWGFAWTLAALAGLGVLQWLWLKWMRWL